ncbi:hypothetical protein L6452_38632 [Arctium lappa]|uniref:Uncharacterized protein n=1 Tax=Arctium lappa TaxID=4217 RepID=A0ACB8XRT7_ARCLA|nr:hypothetical protein L6452_38632 [Arctium lappa]
MGSYCFRRLNHTFSLRWSRDQHQLKDGNGINSKQIHLSQSRFLFRHCLASFSQALGFPASRTPPTGTETPEVDLHCSGWM